MRYWQQILKDELDLRKGKNHSYSLRSFAKHLDLSPAQLSQVMSGKRTLTPKIAEQICKKLGFKDLEKEKFIYSSLSVESENDAVSTQLAHDEFALISDWYHFAILSLAEVKNSKANPIWVSKRLGISHIEAKEALERLIRLGIIEIKEGKINQIKKSLRTTTDVPSLAIRKYHHQNLKNASQKLEDVEVELREFTSITTAIDTKNILEAKKLINEFKRKLSTLLEKGNPTEVYTFSAQLFPVSIKEDKI